MLLAGLVALMVVGMMLLYLTQANRLTTAGYEVSRLQEERALLIRRNTQLRFEISRLTELSGIEERAREMGLEPATDYRHLVVRTHEAEKAFPRSLLAPPAPSARPTPQPTGAEEVSGWWEAQLVELDRWLEAGLAFGIDPDRR